jgi:hypothetical protein
MPTEESADWGKFFSETFPGVIKTATGAYRDIAVGREEARLVREQRRQQAAVAEAAAAAGPPVAVGAAAGLPTWVYGAAALAVAGGIAASVAKGKKKKRSR